jgi:hypothetical protein
MRADPASTLAGLFAVFTTALRATIAAHMPRAGRTIPVLLLIWKRLGQLDRRIAVLGQRLAEGRSVAPRKRPALERPVLVFEPASPRARRQAAEPCPRLPTRPGWLLTQTITVAPFAEQLRRLIDHPEMVALLDAAPQLKTQLRAIMRLLTPELPPSLALPPRPPRPPRLKPPRPERPKKPRRAPCHGARRPKEFWRPGPIRPHWTG